MNPRDEKILLVVKKKQLPEYGHLVPFCIIQKAFPWVDGAELTTDLLKLDECDYLWKAVDPTTQMGWWYGLTPLGKRECERIQHDSVERKKNRNVQIISSIISVLLGFLLGRFF